MLIHAERLGNIVVGAEIERLDLAYFVATARQHDYGSVFASCTDRSQEIVAVDIGKAEIEDDEIGRLSEEFERRLAVRRLEDVIALGGKTHPQKLADGRLIVDHQNLERRGVHAA